MQVQFEISIDDNAITSVAAQICEAVEKTLIDQLGTIKVATEELVSKPKPRQPSIMVPEGVDLPEKERLRASDLRIALLAGKIPEDSGILVDAKATAKLLSVSSRTLYRLSDMKAIPSPVKIGNMTRWRLTELVEWIDNGCPSRRERPVSRRSRHGVSS